MPAFVLHPRLGVLAAAAASSTDGFGERVVAKPRLATGMPITDLTESERHDALASIRNGIGSLEDTESGAAL